MNQRERGEEANQAASIGTKEVSAAITASTLTTLCVFLPLLFATGGMQGIFFSQLAYTVSFALLASLFVALTLIPVMLVPVLTIALIPTLGTELLPEVDEGRISINVQLPVGTKFQVSDALVKSIEKEVQESIPELKTMRTSSGGGRGWMSASGSHAGNISINLVDQDERVRSTDEVISALRRKFSGIPNARIWISARGSLMTRMLVGTRRRSRIAGAYGANCHRWLDHRESVYAILHPNAVQLT